MAAKDEEEDKTRRVRARRDLGYSAYPAFEGCIFQRNQNNHRLNFLRALSLTTMPPAKPVLGPKEASLFKELLTFYETRQLKKGLKAADQILKRCPDHGGTHVSCGRKLQTQI